MPMSVIQEIRVDYSLPLKDIAPLLNDLSDQSVEEGRYAVPDEIEIETRIAEQEMESDARPVRKPTLWHYSSRIISVLSFRSGT
jgi:hypothetical protein